MPNYFPYHYINGQTPPPLPPPRPPSSVHVKRSTTHSTVPYRYYYSTPTGVGNTSISKNDFTQKKSTATTTVDQNQQSSTTTTTTTTTPKKNNETTEQLSWDMLCRSRVGKGIQKSQKESRSVFRPLSLRGKYEDRQGALPVGVWEIFRFRFQNWTKPRWSGRKEKKKYLWAVFSINEKKKKYLWH
jgi:hypothetical protein